MNDFRSAWLSTRLLITSEGKSIDLDSVSAGGLAAAVLPLVPPICIVTAWNPRGQEHAPHENEAANRRLQADLDAKGLRWMPAEGEYGDRSRSEPGVAVGGLTEGEAQKLGRRWGQLAVFYVTEEQVVVLASDGEIRDVRPRGVSGRPRADGGI